MFGVCPASVTSFQNVTSVDTKIGLEFDSSKDFRGIENQKHA